MKIPPINVTPHIEKALTIFSPITAKPLVLNPKNISSLSINPNGGYVYAFYVCGEIVYVGTSLGKLLQSRLNGHLTNPKGTWTKYKLINAVGTVSFLVIETSPNSFRNTLKTELITKLDTLCAMNCTTKCSSKCPAKCKTRCAKACRQKWNERKS